LRCRNEASVGATELNSAKSLIYDSSHSRRRLVEDALELARYRDLVASLVRRDLTVRYKRSVLGFLWTMLNPLLMMIVLTIVFSTFFRFPVEHYAVYLLSGVLLWNFISQSTTQAIHSLVWGSNLIQKIYLPKSVFIFSSILVGLVNLALALIPLALILLVTGHGFSLALLFLPIPMLLTAVFALGVGLFVSALAVFFADIADIYQLVLTILMYLTPIFYPADIVPEKYQLLLHLNPIYYLTEVFRSPIYAGRLPALDTLVYASLLAVGMFLVGWGFFTSKSDEFAYRI
jgi:ABC-type polysaccharide/polyol phosphate export permease